MIRIHTKTNTNPRGLKSNGSYGSRFWNTDERPLLRQSVFVSFMDCEQLQNITNTNVVVGMKHKIIKRKNGKYKQSLIIWLISFYFSKPSHVYAVCFPGPRWIFCHSCSISAVSLRRSTIQIQIFRLLNGQFPF